MCLAFVHLLLEVYCLYGIEDDKNMVIFLRIVSPELNSLGTIAWKINVLLLPTLTHRLKLHMLVNQVRCRLTRILHHSSEFATLPNAYFRH